MEMPGELLEAGSILRKKYDKKITISRKIHADSLDNSVFWV